MIKNSDIDLQGLLHEMVDLVKEKEQAPKTKAVSPDMNFSGFQAPIKGSYYNSGNFSPNAPTDARHKSHQGVDLRAPGGTLIFPIASGIVSAVGTDPKGGNVINITHPQGVTAYYAHLGTVKVNKGDRVGINTPIATLGSSGNASGFPHLHIQVWKNGQLVNPGNFFQVPEFTKFDNKKEKLWISDQTKMEAANFNMQKYKNNSKFAYHKYGEILILADMFNELTKG